MSATESAEAYLKATDERVRAEHHHEVLCRALDVFLGAIGPKSVVRGKAAESVVSDARYIADSPIRRPSHSRATGASHMTTP